ncbi:hypothetical protein BHE74_00045611 [Ensete ventricosum]|uniref:Uncharacterized protein n=1 Tax=Ensete ventricosum TaxID=4639 RepID=A0A444CUP0_ENSVE|nr:hypothetical protein GW17_00048269 [Ensete ventricosum]RWW48308.1 hypothetical protein BHE74_00045611 [Ensete ventricosum]RZR75130.1 hypothetical protein BHM03_00049935 [Ensete ventricosum]
MSRSFIHPRLSEVIGDRQSMQALSITPFTIYGKGSHCPTNIEVQMDMSNEFGIYRKHMRNNKSYMRLNRII